MVLQLMISRGGGVAGPSAAGIPESEAFFGLWFDEV